MPKPSQKIFQKRHACFSVEAPFQRPPEHPSKRTPAAIFPTPETWPRSFDVSELERKIPSFWPVHRTEDGEILLTEEQIRLLAAELIKERREELCAKYTEIMADFTDGYERALARASRESSAVH